MADAQPTPSTSSPSRAAAKDYTAHIVTQALEDVRDTMIASSSASPSILSMDTPQAVRSRRLFLGPMPQGKLLADNARADIGSELNDEEFHQLLDEFMERHGLQTFLRLGGKTEDWGEGAARKVRDKMRRKWEGSEWVKAVRERKARGKGKGKADAGIGLGMGVGRGIEWVGGSFDVAEVLGVDLLHGEDGDENLQGRKPDKDGASGEDEARSKPDEDILSLKGSAASPRTNRPASTAYESFATARSTFSGLRSSVSLAGPSKETAMDSSTINLSQDVTVVPASSSSQTQLTLAPVAEGTNPQDSRSRNSSTESHKQSAASSTPLLPYEFTNDERPQTGSQTLLKAVKSDRDVHHSSGAFKSILTAPGKITPKGKIVHYPDTSDNLDASASVATGADDSEDMVLGTSGKPTANEVPAAPTHVLSRSADEPGATSAAASEATIAEIRGDVQVGQDGVKMRDRMLARVFHCSHTNISTIFDEKECRVTRGMLSRDWAEFMVIWRKNRVELYEDYSMPCQERILGHKHIAFAIPLDPRKTTISLFSPVDMSFCLVCPPIPVKENALSVGRRILHRSHDGLNLFVLKLKCRSRAIDWYWKIWTALGGKLSDTLQVHCPMFNGSVAFEIPPTADGYKDFTRDLVLAKFEKSLANLPDWQDLRRRPEMKGRKLMLCWRMDMKLDWLWVEDDVDGNRREWEVVYGLMMSSTKYSARLEVRLAQHYSTQLTQRDGKRLHEPPSIEGYLHRIRRNSQAKAALVYLAVYDGQLFTIRTSVADPPAAPTSLIALAGKAGHGTNSFRRQEKDRATKQIQNATLFCDLRDVLAVRRAFQMVVRTEGEGYEANVSRERSVAHEERGSGDTVEEGLVNGVGALQVPGMFQELGAQIVWPRLEVSNSDGEDEGGDEGLAKAADKGKMRMRRSFELVYKSGYVMRFEAHSCRVAIDWITRLRDLVAYWKLRHRADARLEMDMLQACTGRGGVTVVKRECDLPHGHTPPSVPDAEDASVYLDAFWNVCAVNWCRPILKSGRLFTKRKFRGQYGHTQLILVQGHLLQFDLTQNPHMNHQRTNTITLLDAYICSGYFAAMALPADEYNPNSPPVARLFADGLESIDAEEDTLFMLWYRPHHVRKDSTVNKMEETFIPSLSAKHKVLMCRARSRLERDAWCWALNCEVERLARATRRREQKARDQGAPRK